MPNGGWIVKLNELETVQQINILLRARIESLKKLIKS